MKTVAFFNNKGGVGKTSLVYHLAWMFADMGHQVMAADLDPQANLTSMFLDEPEVETLFPDNAPPQTVLGVVQPLLKRRGDIERTKSRRISDHIGLIPGDLGLSAFEDRLSDAWSQCLDDDPDNSEYGFRVTTAFYRMLAEASADAGASIALIDVGPNIGAMNRSALVAADFVVIPLGADLFSLRGLENLGPTLQSWRGGWNERKPRCKSGTVSPMPAGQMQPIGYVLFNPSVRENRPVKSYQKWADRIPDLYRKQIVGGGPAPATPEDENCLAMIKHFKSLMPMAQEVRKPMFHLTAADGAIGGHAAAVSDCRSQFERLAGRILHRIGMPGAGD
ncbi:MAG: ParA family protein [Phycisphaerae bacterium]